MTAKTPKAKATSVRKLITSRDAAARRQGFELVKQLDDPEVYDVLVEGATYGSGDLVPNNAFTGAKIRQHELSYMFAWLLAASNHPVKEQVTGLRLGRWDYKQPPIGDMEFGWLSGFPALERLWVGDEAGAELTGLDQVPLKELHLDGHEGMALHGHPTLQIVTGGVEFKAGESWPELRSVNLNNRSLPAALGEGAPNLEDIEVILPQGGALELIGLSKLKKLKVAGNCVVKDCAVLAEVTFRSGQLNIVDTPALKELELSGGVHPECDLSKLTSVTHLRFGNRIGARRITVPPNAELGPTRLGLRLKPNVAFSGVEDLGNVTDLHPLTELTINCGDAPLSLAPLAAAHDLRELRLKGAGIIDLEPLASLPELRILDIRGCKGVTDLTPMISTPMLQIVAIQDSGVVRAPAELGEIASRDSHPSFSQARQANTPKPRLEASEPAHDTDSSNWDRVLHGLASSRLNTKIEAVDLASSLGPNEIEELLSKVSVVKHRLRLREPLKVDNAGDAPAIVTRLLKAAPPNSKAAEKFRGLTALEVVGKRDTNYSFENMETFSSLEHLVIGKGRGLELDFAAMTNLHTLVISSKRIERLTLPPSLKRLLLHRSTLGDALVQEITHSNVEELALCDSFFWRLNATNQAEFAPMSVRSLTVEVFQASHLLSLFDWPELTEIELVEQRGLGKHPFPALDSSLKFEGERIWVKSLGDIPEDTDPAIRALMAERELRSKSSWRPTN